MSSARALVLSDKERIRWEIGTQAPIVVSCHIEADAERPDLAAVPRRISITAILGRDRRFERSVLEASGDDNTDADAPAAKPADLAEPPDTDTPDREGRDMADWKTNRQQRGTVLVIVLVSLTVAMTLVVGWASVAALESGKAARALDPRRRFG